MKAPAKIKIIKRGFEKYSGFLGPIRFEDGVSVDVVPFYLVNRIAASLEVAYLDEDEAEAPAGAAVALMENLTTRANEVEELARQTEDERTLEQRAAAVARDRAPVDKFFTKEELETVADKGIKALREVAQPWGVKGRAIPELVREILAAQSAYLKDRDARRAAVGLATENEAAAAEEVLAEDVVAEDVVTDPPAEEVSGETADEMSLAEAIAKATNVTLADAITDAAADAQKAE